MSRLKRPAPPQTAIRLETILPLDRQILLYSRQSTMEQVGNTSTEIQSSGMADYLERLGWDKAKMRLIDRDLGLSATRKRIHERPGMLEAFEMIKSGQVGAIAAQNEDRFFRDETQIEPNIFIDACCRNNVLVITFDTIYDFAHPIRGDYFKDQFRERAKQASNYIKTHIKGRLIPGKQMFSRRGQWDGRHIIRGFMVDLREKLPNGQANPTYRKYVPFEPDLPVLQAYYAIFRQTVGSLVATWQQIEAHGPYFPDVTEDLVPHGFRGPIKIKGRSSITGQPHYTRQGLDELFTNVHYIGHWVFQGAIVQWDNHPAIVPIADFMYAFNHLSETDFLGDPNPSYTPYRVYVRYDKDARSVSPPTYNGLIFSNDVAEAEHQPVRSRWSQAKQAYVYRLDESAGQKSQWSIYCRDVDGVIDEMLRSRLQATVVDENLWREVVDNTMSDERSGVKRIKRAIQDAEKTKRSLVIGLRAVTNPQMVLEIEHDYEMVCSEVERLNTELSALSVKDKQISTMRQARPVIEKIIERWSSVPTEERRDLLVGFAQRILVSKLRARKSIESHTSLVK